MMSFLSIYFWALETMTCLNLLFLIRFKTFGVSHFQALISWFVVHIFSTVAGPAKLIEELSFLFGYEKVDNYWCFCSLLFPLFFTYLKNVFVLSFPIFRIKKLFMGLYCIGGTSTSAPKSTSGSQRSVQQRSNYQIPTSALYEATEDTRASGSSVQAALAGRAGYGIYRYFRVCFPLVKVCSVDNLGCVVMVMF